MPSFGSIGEFAIGEALPGSPSNDVTLVAENGSYLISGQDLRFVLAKLFIADSGTYSVTGQTANLALQNLFDVDAGSYSITGQDVTFDLSDPQLMVDNGEYIIVGSSIQNTQRIDFDLDQGSYTVTGQIATFDFPISYFFADPGTYSIVGQDARLIVDYIVSAENGSYTITGQDSTAEHFIFFDAERGRYWLTGFSAVTYQQRILSAESGVYQIIPLDAAFAFGGTASVALLLLLRNNRSMFLRQSTNGQDIKLGPFLDPSDITIKKTLLSINNTDILLSSGGSSFISKNSGGASHDIDGWYTATLDAVDTVSVGILDVQTHVAGSIPTHNLFYVLEEKVYDAFYDLGSIGTNPGDQFLNFNINVPGASFQVDTSATVYIKETQVTVTFSANQNIEGVPLVIIFENADLSDFLVINDVDITKSGSAATVTLPTSFTANTISLNWAVRHATTKRVYGTGTFSVQYAPHED